jgi:hypothetical protein
MRGAQTWGWVIVRDITVDGSEVISTTSWLGVSYAQRRSCLFCCFPNVRVVQVLMPAIERTEYSPSVCLTTGFKGLEKSFSKTPTCSNCYPSRPPFPSTILPDRRCSSGWQYECQCLTWATGVDKHVESFCRFSELCSDLFPSTSAVFRLTSFQLLVPALASVFAKDIGTRWSLSMC